MDFKSLVKKIIKESQLGKTRDTVAKNVSIELFNELINTLKTLTVEEGRVFKQLQT